MLRESAIRASYGLILMVAMGLCELGCAAAAAGRSHGEARGIARASVGSGGNYARLPGTTAEHRGIEDIRVTDAAPSEVASIGV